MNGINGKYSRKESRIPISAQRAENSRSVWATISRSGQGIFGRGGRDIE